MTIGGNNHDATIRNPDLSVNCRIRLLDWHDRSGLSNGKDKFFTISGGAETSLSFCDARWLKSFSPVWLSIHATSCLVKHNCSWVKSGAFWPFSFWTESSSTGYCSWYRAWSSALYVWWRASPFSSLSAWLPDERACVLWS